MYTYIHTYIYIYMCIYVYICIYVIDSKKPLCNETVMRCRIYFLLALFPVQTPMLARGLLTMIVTRTMITTIIMHIYI